MSHTASSLSPHSGPFHNAIGVFDSGVGGLSVLRAIRAAMPAEHLVYVADTGHAPYGDQSSAHITQRTLTVGNWLAEQGVKAITIACNTATVVAAKTLRGGYGLRLDAGTLRLFRRCSSRHTAGDGRLR